MTDESMSEDELAELEAMLEGEDEPEEAVAEESEDETEILMEEVEDEELEVKVEEAPKPKAKGQDLEIDPEQWAKDVAFKESNLSEAFQNQASLFGYYAMIAAKAARKAADLKNKLTLVEASVYNEMKEEIESENKKPVDAQITKLMKLDPRIIKAQSNLNDADERESIAKGLLESFRHRRDMLIQAGADTREEMKGEMRMKEITASRESMIDSARRKVGAG